MPARKTTASKAKTTTRARVKAPSLPEPGTVQHREAATELELRVACLEQCLDLLLIRFAVTESTAQAALDRIKLTQARDTEELIGL